MDKNYHETESQLSEQQDAEKALHSNFRPKDDSLDSTPKSEIELSKEKEEMQRQARFGTKLQGEIGEGISTRVATERLGLMPDPRFDQTKQGLDGVYRDSGGKLVVVESKFDERGIRALNGDQMQPEWVERTAQKMSTPGDKYYTPGNAEIAADLRSQGVDRVRRLVITTDPSSLEIKVYEGRPNGNWQEIDTWNAWDLEQPYLMI